MQTTVFDVFPAYIESLHNRQKDLQLALDQAGISAEELGVGSVLVLAAGRDGNLPQAARDLQEAGGRAAKYLPAILTFGVTKKIDVRPLLRLTNLIDRGLFSYPLIH